MTKPTDQKDGDGQQQEILSGELVGPVEGDEKTVAQSQALSRFQQNIESTLNAYDEERGDGISLTQIWQDCLRMHDDNEMLRQNMYQLQVLLQNQQHQYYEIQKDLNRRRQELDTNADDYMEKLAAIQDMDGKLVKTIRLVAQCVRDIKKEVRATEFQSSYYYHINILQQFFAGLSAILFKHLSEGDQLRVIQHEIRGLARMFMLTEHDEDQ